MGTDDRLENINAFFQRLGLNRDADVGSASYWESLNRKIQAATGKPVWETDHSDPMSQSVVDLFFSTPGIAASFLATDLPRLTQVLMALDTLPGFPSEPKTVAEVGGGPGIASLWLARSFPDAVFTVYDQSENALRVGEIWAKALSIANVRYEKATYRELAQCNPPKGADLILGLGALNLMVTGPQLSATLDPETLASPLREVISDFAGACRSLAGPGGVIYFSQGSFNDSGLLCLFDGFRQNGLGIDWRHTLCVGEGDGPGFSFKAIHLFAQPGRPSVFTSAREDLQTFLFSGKMARFSDKILLGYGDFESWLGLLSDGTKLADIEARHLDGRHERHTVYVKSGMLGFFSTHSRGGRSGFVYNAASFEAAVGRLSGIVQQYNEKKITLIRVSWHAYFSHVSCN